MGDDTKLTEMLNEAADFAAATAARADDRAWRKLLTYAPKEITALSAALAEIERLRKALEWYASSEAWTVRQTEGPDGDYGKRARAALSPTPPEK
jgi:hypothetical protein